MTAPRPIAEPAGSAASTALARVCAAVRRLVPVGERGRSQSDAVFAFSVRVASAGLLYLSQIALARWMGATEYGIYVLAWTWVLVLGGMSHLGLSTVMIRQLPAYAEGQDWSAMRGLLFGGRLLALGVGTLVAALGILGLTLFGHRLEPARLMPAYLALVCIPMYALSDLQDGIGRGNGWMGAALVPPYVLRPLIILLVMGAIHLFGGPMTATSAALAAIIATWSATLVQFLVVGRHLARKVPRGPRVYAFPTWLGMGAPLLAIYGAELILQNADVILLSWHRPPGEVGMYFAAAKTMALVMFVHYAVGSAMAHRFSALAARGDRAGLEAGVRDAVRWTFWPSLAAAVALLALGRPLLSLFSPEFVTAYPVMAILVLGFLARASMGPAEFLLNMLGEQRLCAAVVAGAAALAVALHVVLIPMHGMLGAAAATASALAVQAGLLAVVARRRLGLRIWIIDHLRH